MLIRFQVTNFRSILSTAELSMIAVDQDRDEVRPAELLGESLLTVAAIFGPNASGKSNVIAAFTWLRDAVQHSLRLWDRDIPIESHAFGNGPDTPSEFTVDLLVGGVRFEYVLQLDRTMVYYEGLFHYPEKKRRRIFEREGSELKLQRGLGGLSGTRELLTEATLALSVAARFKEPLVSDFVRTLTRAQTFGMPRRSRLGRTSGRYLPAARSSIRWFDNQATATQPALFDETDLPTPDRDLALALLRMADMGIVDVLIDEDEVPRAGDPGSVRLMRGVRLVHEAEEEQIPLDFIAESQGTQIWFDLIGPVLVALQAGTTLLFDELDASLHPTLTAQLIRLFHERATNPRGAQLIFAAHNTSLLNHLNRDEVWFTEKTRAGATRLGALAEFAGERVRTSQNLERAYLHGRFGAVPDVNQTDLLRSLRRIG
ncbi:ATP/GTP-binding protein [Frankia sp. R82]|uniref:AAA family ATPase n=1 Tax=Frankia sp. R82 TaxID=2950553 RepID=UPI002043356F|nr:ATP-binding protein [Frankia sp. R82]MCM3882815.1 ATP-binding protein [Frankia sp. R82]